jgi:tripartite-type tricarboxylate transporter receptor subunit TctC
MEPHGPPASEKLVAVVSARRLRAHTGQASAGMNTLSLRLVATFFQKQTGTQFVIVPYRAAVSVIEDLVAGRTDLAIDTPIRLPLVQSGNIKAYAVTSEARLAVAPDIPTFAEVGLPALSYSQWYGLFAPAGTSQSIVDKLKFAAVEALAGSGRACSACTIWNGAFPARAADSRGTRGHAKGRCRKMVAAHQGTRD